MRVLFDNGTPRGLAASLSDHVIEETRDRGWDTFRNGELLEAAEVAGFDVFVTLILTLALLVSVRPALRAARVDLGAVLKNE